MARANWNFEARAWLQDEELRACSPATRGIWMDLICKMQLNGQSGEIWGTATELAKGICQPEELVSAARELKDRQAAQVRFDGSVFYLRNRRMFRTAERRKSNADRQMQYRDRVRNDPVTQAFERFWKVFPSGRKHAKGDTREAFRKAAEKADAELIIAAATEYAASEKGQSKFVQGPEPWLNQERWNDDRAAWRDLDKQDDVDTVFRKVSREEFLEAVQMKRFKDGPRRATSDPKWVFGTLRDGTRIECRDYWLPKQNESGNE